MHIATNLIGNYQVYTVSKPYPRICLIHYHEIGLKGHNRARFEQRLVQNVQALFSREPIGKVQRISGRLLVPIQSGTSYKDACHIEDLLCSIPGVQRVSCGYECERDMDQIYDAAIQAAHDAAPFQSFKVTARRNHTDFPVHSMDMNRLVGAKLCDEFPDAKVIMKNPECNVHVEVIQGSAYVYARSVRGIGGLPVGTGGKVVMLLSSGIDSPVATWRLAKRGAQCIAVHFSGRPQTSSTSEYLVDDIAHVLERSGCIARLYVVPFGDYQRQIAAGAPPELRVILYRRLMFKVACAIAKQENAKALGTGESLGQVASQTLDNIYVTDQACDRPVLRPLIGADKLEISDRAEKIGTFKISSEDAPDCCTLFMPRRPETHAHLPRVLDAEKAFPEDEWVTQIVQNAEVHDYNCPGYRPARTAPKRTEERLA